MATIHTTRSRRYELLGTLKGEQPTEHLESEGERLIKDLSKKQLDKFLSLDKQKNQEKEFDRGSGFVPLSIYNAGSSTVEEIVRKTDRADRYERLLVDGGLTEEEAAAVLNGNDLTFPNSKAEPSVRLKRADEIRNVLERLDRQGVDREQQEQEREVRIGRHEKELALAVKPDSDETKLLEFALSCRNGGTGQDIRPLDHPINRLNELHDSLFKEGQQRDPEKAAKTVKRKRWQLLASTLSPYGPTFEPNTEKSRKNSKWDKQTISKTTAESKSFRTKEYSCKRETFYTIQNGKIVELKEKDILKREDTKGKDERNVRDVVKNSGVPFVIPSTSPSISQEDMPPLCHPPPQGPRMEERLMPLGVKGAKDYYNKGTPSKVLYIKNLGRTVIEQDLVRLFCEYQKDGEPHIVYRLMNSGKMRGQAFVTFPCVGAASLALEKVNGTIVKGKPVIIQFGKCSS